MHSVTKQTIHTLFICSMLTLHVAITQTFSLESLSPKNLTSLFSSKQFENILQENYSIHDTDSGKLVVDNPYGEIYVKAEWDKKEISVHATEKTGKDEQLHNFELVVAPASELNNAVTLPLKQKDKKLKYSINLTLVVPKGITMHLKTKNRAINVEKASGKLAMTSESGSVSVGTALDAVHAVTKTGAITITQAHAPIKVTTEKGYVTIGNARDSIFANANRGHMCIACTQVPSTSTIAINTQGTMELTLPKDVNADLCATTKKGRLTCEHHVTIKPKTVKLNKETWRQFQRQVEGTLGSGEARIKISAHGNIKLLETKEETRKA